MFTASIQPYNELLQFVEKTQPKLSFWGVKSLIIEGSKETHSLDSIAIRVFDLVKQNYEFSEKDREIGRKIMARIKEIYSESDLQVKKSNLLTRILEAIRGFFEIFNDEHFVGRYRLDLCFGEDIFELYTENQFKREFGMSPTIAEEHGWKLWEIIGGEAPHRWGIVERKSSPLFFGICG